MVGDGLHPWVADKHLLDTAGGRVASERCMEVGVELGTDARKLVSESVNNVRGLLIKSRILPVAMGQGSTGLDLNADLMTKFPKAGVEGMADEAVSGRRRAWYTDPIGLRQPQAMGIEGGSQADEYLFETWVEGRGTRVFGCCQRRGDCTRIARRESTIPARFKS